LTLWKIKKNYNKIIYKDSNGVYLAPTMLVASYKKKNQIVVMFVRK
jgi:hypothetical protein